MSGRDRVHGIGFSYDCRIGFHAYERHIKQRLVIDFEVVTSWRAAALVDQPERLVNYYEANLAIQQLLGSKEYQLIEAVAEDVARLLCTQFPVSEARVKVTKQPFDMPNVGCVAVECWRTPADFA